jgi:hypothetical protein
MKTCLNWFTVLMSILLSVDKCQGWESSTQGKELISRFDVHSIKPVAQDGRNDHFAFRALLFDGFGYTSLMLQKSSGERRLVYESSRNDEERQTNIIEKVVIVLSDEQFDRLLRLWQQMDDKLKGQRQAPPSEDAGIGIIEFAEGFDYKSRFLSVEGEFGINFYSLLDAVRSTFKPRLNKPSHKDGKK